MSKKSFLMSLLAVLMLSSIAQAEVKGSDKPKEVKATKKALTVDEMKAKSLKNLDSRIAQLQTTKDCVEKATTKKEIKECRPTKKHKKSKK